MNVRNESFFPRVAIRLAEFASKGSTSILDVARITLRHLKEQTHVASGFLIMIQQKICTIINERNRNGA